VPHPEDGYPDGERLRETAVRPQLALASRGQDLPQALAGLAESELARLRRP